MRTFDPYRETLQVSKIRVGVSPKTLKEDLKSLKSDGEFRQSRLQLKIYSRILETREEAYVHSMKYRQLTLLQRIRKGLNNNTYKVIS